MPSSAAPSSAPFAGRLGPSTGAQGSSLAVKPCEAIASTPRSSRDISSYSGLNSAKSSALTAFSNMFTAPMETAADNRPATEDMMQPSPSPPQGATSNPFKTALHKFAQKKKERAAAAANLSNAATSSFFSRRNNKAAAQQKPQALPGSVKQVNTGQLPPVWATPSPAPPRKLSSPVDSASPRLRSLSSADSENDDVASRSADHSGRNRHSLHEDELEQEAHGTPTYTHAKSHHHLHHHNGGNKGAPLTANPVLASASSSRNASGNLRYTQFERLLEKEVVDLDQLRKLSWGGVPTTYRPTVWRLLLGCMPPKQDRRAAMLGRKRQEYVELLQQYYYIPDTDRGTREQTTLRQILVDIPRTNADVKLFQNERIHQCMERVLYIWAIRHPASGYVQGINDLMTPFLVVFLSAFIDEPQTCDLSKVSDANLQIVEADSYWCLTKLLDDIQDHYTFAQPGLQRMVQRMEELVHRCDAELFEHIVERENVQFVQFAFRWMNCLLMRELPLDGIVRIWDTYLCEDSGFESFHVYVCAAILMTFGETLKTLEFQDLVLFLQSLPTKDWDENEIEPLLSRAFILQTYFADAPSHLSSQAAQ
ncbi:TBC1 domain family member [Phytophthora fragariae]|uniref:TBC1 domain family member n=1 Tax=Phytophthora fragariae TaxID=53985 RepID=A0A6A3E9X1_9STRA|nr:TBC1 domain family member [Phytophthora fragariae]KAE9091696.1 TBC1 domain family member [Phytophthora fragariae]